MKFFNIKILLINKFINNESYDFSVNQILIIILLYVIFKSRNMKQ